MSKQPVILITGGAGYVGSTLIRTCLERGYRIRCLDLLVYGGKAISGFISHPDFELIPGDVRDVDAVDRVMEGVDVVVHLAAVVGDMPCQVAPRSAYQINFEGTKVVSESAKRHKVKRFIFASTCSNYGIADTSVPATETRDLNPVSLYAETKIDCESYLLSIGDENFQPTILRFGTAFGVSFRTRFDLLVNSFVYEALNEDEIVVFASNMWRPYVHVADMSHVMHTVIDADLSLVGCEIFNGGATHQNHIKEEVVNMIVDEIPELRVKYANDIDDKRNYRVDFTKLESRLDYKPTKSVRDGIKELVSCFKYGILTKDDYEGNNLDHLKQFFKSKESELSR